jgi:hypothetical protein
MELDQSTNDVLYSLSHQQDSSIYDRLKTIESRLSDGENILNMSKFDFFNMANDLKDINKILYTMDSAKQFTNQEKEKQLSQMANQQLKELIKKDDVLSLTIREFLENFLNHWHRIILDLFDVSRYPVFDSSVDKTGFVFLTRLGEHLYHICTRNNGLIYFGTGMVIVSFFLYFILVSS